MRKKKTNNKPATSIAVLQPSFDRSNYLAAFPGILMCLLTFLVLIVDVLIPDTFYKQYEDYPAMFNFINIIIAFAGIAYWALSASRRNNILKDSIGSISSLCFALFICCIGISTVINGLDAKAVHGVAYRNIGVFRIFILIAVYMLLSSCLNSRHIQNQITVMSMLVSDLIAVSVIADKYFYEIHAYDAKKDLSAIFFNGNHYGYFLVMMALLGTGFFLRSCDLKHRVIGGASLLLNLFVLILNASSGCLIAFATAFCISIILSIITDRSSARYCVILVAAFLAFGIVAEIATGNISRIASELFNDIRLLLSGGENSYAAGHNRWLLWSVTAEYIMQKPLFGFGCEGLDPILMAETGRGNPHNEILSYASQFGIPAAVFYVFGVISVMIHSIRGQRINSPAAFSSLAAASGYFISSFFGVPMFYTLPFFFIYLGLSCSKSEM